MRVEEADVDVACPRIVVAGNEAGPGVFCRLKDSISTSTATTTPRARVVPECGGVCPPSDRPPSPIQIAREKIDDALDNLYVATGVKRAHVAAAVVAMLDMNAAPSRSASPQF